MTTESTPLFATVAVRERPKPGIRYVSGNLVCEEHLVKGSYRIRYWSPSAAIKPDAFLTPGAADPELPPLDEPIACAFRLNVDGQDLWDGWEWIGAGSEAGPQPRSQKAVVELVHHQRQIGVKVRTLLDGTPFLVRWIEIANRADHPVTIGAVSPLSGFLFGAHRIGENLPPNAESVFSLGYFPSGDWARECDFRWLPLPDGTHAYGSFGYGPPFFVVRNEVTHELFLGHLAWSGSFKIELFNDHTPWRESAWLYARIGLAGPGPVRVLDSGETVTTPAVHLGHFHAGLDAAIQSNHLHVRRSVLPKLPEGRTRPVEMNSWGYVAEEISEENLFASIDFAADVGVELFTIDAGWFGDLESSWSEMVGDWKVGNRLPRGLEPVFDYARRKGLLCGLWVDIERIGRNSELYRQHSDWVAQRHGEPAANRWQEWGRPGTNLDFTRPEVVGHVEATLSSIIERYQLDVFRLDYNTNLGPSGAQTIRHGFTENSYWRHYQAVYALYERIRRRFPRLMLENCAGGGGRNDLGMLANFHWTQMSDEWGAVRALKILNGFTLALPPEYCLGFVGYLTNENYRYGDLDFRLRALLFGHYCITRLAPSVTELPPTAKERVRHTIDLYKRVVRPMIASCRVHHHTPVLPNDEAGAWTVFEYVSEDQTTAYAGIFRLAGSRERDYLFRPRGLDRSGRYRVTFDNTEEVVEITGLELIREGLPVVVDSPLTSELLWFKRC